MRLAARPKSHSRCRSVAEGDGTRQISVLSIMAQDENESMAVTQDQELEKLKYHFGACRHLLDCESLRDAYDKGSEQRRHINYSTCREKIRHPALKRQLARSAVFWGAMLVFSLLQGQSDVYV